MENQFYQFVINQSGLKESEQVKTAAQMFLDGKSIAEVIFSEDVWSEKKQSFWFFDKIESSVSRYKHFKSKQEKYITDLESRTQSDFSEAVTSVNTARNIIELEELYRPYKRKKKTKATMAREAGLQGFADEIISLSKEGKNFENGLEPEAKKHINPSQGYITYETVLKGVQDILVEKILMQPELRKNLFDYAFKNSKIKIKAGDKYSEGGKFTNFIKANPQGSAFYLNPKNYDKFPQIKKAWEDGYLRVTLDADWIKPLEDFQKPFSTEQQVGDIKDFIMNCGKKALEIHALPSVSGEIFDSFFEASREVYYSKLKNDYNNLLVTPAFGNKPVLSFVGKPEGESTFVLASHHGEYISSTRISLGAEGVVESLKGLLKDISKNIEIGCIAILLNEVTRKAEKLIAKAIEELGMKDLQIVMAEGSGLSRFINSEEAKFGFEEKIGNDALLAFYLAKRVQNPLFEYGQHEPSTLIEVPHFIEKEALNKELKKCLSYHVAQFGLETGNFKPGLVNNLEWFESNERVLELSKKVSESKDLNDKKSLSSVFNPTEFERFSKFFKFKDSLSLLDKARVDVESYSRIKDVFKEESVSLLSGPVKGLKLSEKSQNLLGSNLFGYLKDELERPFYDFRKPYKVFSFSKGIESIEDVKEDNLYWGIVTKFSSFGAFVDMGVGVDGLIHLSELSNEYVSDPRKILRLGQWVLIKALKIDTAKKQLSFSKTKAEQGTSKRPSSNRNFTDKKASTSGNKNFNKKKSFDKKPGAKSNSKSGKSFSKGPRKPQQPFNNPFAALSELKK